MVESCPMLFEQSGQRLTLRLTRSSGSFSGFLPPACAMSGLPPPPPADNWSQLFDDSSGPLFCLAQDLNRQLRPDLPCLRYCPAITAIPLLPSFFLTVSAAAASSLPTMLPALSCSVDNIAKRLGLNIGETAIHQFVLQS